MTRINANVSRRGLLLGAGAMAAAGLLAACGDDTEPTTASSPAKPKPTGPWSFTDDRGKTISLPAYPQRLVCQTGPAAALWDYGIASVGLFGPQTRPDGGRELETGSLDLAKLTAIGGAEWGDFNLEQYAALTPDLLVTTVFDDQLWYVPEESLDKIGKIAPIAALQVESKNLPDVLARFLDLAVSLGVDRESELVKKAKGDFDKASEDLRGVLAAKPGLKVLAVSATKDEIYFAKPKDVTDLDYFGTLGMGLVQPGGPDDYWEVASWEKADRYPADLIIYDARGYEALPLAEARKVPTFQKLPAVQADQVAAWKHLVPPSYQQVTVALKEMAETISRSRTDIVA
ncbi:iron complex transport system substrate-binding protein [Allocatelliglobosispora scoriae]|uniref:Iron complex transport system substrate-binding protein n=1 Tax=Allocatelliglobosispora scoriae TaxID=643052 RepID=A0A841BJC0_9ACTN|nr:ABC transporter substrate-binding protein [Allocatelliglobosispora scoriae]MBB5868354.1 iron complex transport system substrate-binding protein [Allocatelliglobosispora scoriae]